MKTNHELPANTAQELRQRMQSIRHELPGDVQQARTQVHNLIDWKYYVRTYPQFVLPTVALAAYALVPQSGRSASPPNRVAGLKTKTTEQGPEKKQNVPDEQTQQASLISGLAGAALTIATRSLVSMATKYGTDYLSRQFATHGASLARGNDSPAKPGQTPSRSIASEEAKP